MIADTETQLDRSLEPVVKSPIDYTLKLPRCDKTTLSNGIDVFSIQLGKVDALTVAFVFDAGVAFERKSGVAAMTNYMLKSGTSRKNSFEINEHFEYHGAWLNQGVQSETASLSLRCLNKHCEVLFPIVAELIRDSTFPQGELDLSKSNVVQQLEMALHDNSFLADREINVSLFGESHPYGKHADPAHLNQVNREDLVAFFDSQYVNGVCRIVVSGKLPPNLFPLLEHSFGGLLLRGSAPKYKYPTQTPEPAQHRFRSLPGKNEGTQASLRIARNFPNCHNPDYPKVQVLNTIFGGFFGSRLMKNLREDKGYTYGVHSYLTNKIQSSSLVIESEVNKDDHKLAADEIYTEMNRLQQDLISLEELEAARNASIGELLTNLNNPPFVAKYWINLVLHGLDESHFYNYINALKFITPEELRQLAGKYLKKEDFFQIVVV